LPEVIVDTSPLQYLHQVEHLELLPRLFRRITVAGAVISELAAGRQRGLNLPVPEELPWVVTAEPICPAGTLVAWELGEGESASLSLAVERPGAWLILDDRLARQAAASLNLPFLGTAGVLLRAKRVGPPLHGWTGFGPTECTRLPAHRTDAADHPAAGGGGILTRNSTPYVIGTGTKAGSWAAHRTAGIAVDRITGGCGSTTIRWSWSRRIGGEPVPAGSPRQPGTAGPVADNRRKRQEQCARLGQGTGSSGGPAPPWT
jgi:uncharacterized protein